MNNLGFLFALIGSVFSALYVVPKKLSCLKPIVYVFFMGLGFFAASALALALQLPNEPFFHPLLLVACLGGIIYTVASNFVLEAIDRIGLAKANQWKGLQGPIGILMIMLALSEFLQTKVVLIFCAAIFITGAAMLFTVNGKNNSRTDPKGILYAVLAAFFYGIFALIQKYMSIMGFIQMQQIYIALFIAISSGAYLLFTKEPVKIIDKQNLLPIIGGGIYYLCSIFSSIAFGLIPGSIAFMIHQLNAVWLLFIGIVAFHEINWQKYWCRIFLGLVSSLLGVFILLFAQGA